LLLVLCVVVVSVTGRTVLFNRHSTPTEWTQTGFAPKDVSMTFIVALTQRNLDLLESTFWAVSTPSSPQYRNFMKADEILDMIAPKQEHHDYVANWLRLHGVSDITSHRDSLVVKSTVRTVEQIFQTTVLTFQSAKGEEIHRAYGEMSIPDDVARYVRFVEGISSFPIRHYKLQTSARTAPDAQPGVIPQTVQTIYSVPPQTSGANPETSQGVIEFQGQCYRPADLQKYASLCDITVAPITPDHSVGPNNPNSPQLEASLDIEFVATINNAATSWFWLEDGQGWLYQYVNHFFSTTDVPQVVSISYGWSEADQCDIDPDECQQLGVDSQGYVAAVNAEFQKIALRGVSIMVASGDSGANGRTDPDCTLKTLKPDYPAASPYITSVGATQFNDPEFKLASPPPICNGAYSCVSGGTEVAVSFQHANFASGGGFSSYAPQPDYQTDAVSGYLKSGVALPPAGYYNASNRGYPDISAVGSDVLIYQGSVYDVGGTSCSAPATAAIVGVLNQVAMKSDGKPLGFLNPLIYQMAAADPTTFIDITVGDNKCTEGGCRPSCQGFLCTTGWDPVTGFGSPNTANIIKYMQQNIFKN